MKAYLDTLPLVTALWWFIENTPEDDLAARNEIFFYLRERTRKSNYWRSN